MDPSRTIFMLLVGAVLCAAVLLSGAPSALAEDFRIDNAVYVAGQKEPPTESTTIFSGGVVYDCIKAPAETVIFDRSAGRFTLLNLKSRTRAELTTDELAAFTDRLQQVYARSSDPLVKFLAAPNFQQRFDEATRELSLSSESVSYRLLLAREEEQATVEAYHEFSDWYARLNALLAPGSQPPFARLLVNAALAQRKAMPSQVTLTLVPGKSNRQPITVHSTHRVVRPLTAADLDRMAKTRESMVGFKSLSFEQYRKLELR
jgi:hypothetical protein